MQQVLQHVQTLEGSHNVQEDCWWAHVLFKPMWRMRVPHMHTVRVQIREGTGDPRDASEGRWHMEVRNVHVRRMTAETLCDAHSVRTKINQVVDRTKQTKVAFGPN